MSLSESGTCCVSPVDVMMPPPPARYPHPFNAATASPTPRLFVCNDITEIPIHGRDGPGTGTFIAPAPALLHLPAFVNNFLYPAIKILPLLVSLPSSLLHSIYKPNLKTKNTISSLFQPQQSINPTTKPSTPSHQSKWPTTTLPPSSPTSTPPPAPFRTPLATSPAALATRPRARPRSRRLRPSTRLPTLPPSSPVPPSPARVPSLRTALIAPRVLGTRPQAPLRRLLADSSAASP